MFKKSDNKGDKTPKQETKDHAEKAEDKANPPEQKAEKESAAAGEAKKS